MKNLLTILAFAVILASSACSNSGSSNYKPESTGTPYEMFVVATPQEWNGNLGDTLRAVIGRDVEMLNQSEPHFSLRNVPVASMNGLIAKHRNLMVVTISDSTKTSSISANYDVNAAPQAIIYLNSPSEDSLANYISANQDKIMRFLDKIEQDRFVTRMKKFPAKDINNFVDSMFHIKTSIPQGYTLRNSIGDDFAWISYEMPFASQGIIIYSYPYTKGMEFTPEFLVEMRNKFVSNIPGQLENTFMSTSDYVDPTTIVRTINGTKWIEMKGFWELKNDFMGGPFRSYTAIDRTDNQVITIDTYVFSPKESKGKRNYIKQLEAIVKTVSLD